MSKDIIINVTPYETRVALLEDNTLVELYVEREESKRILGNIYKGRVTKVLPGMQAAFVDIGLERDAFLYVLDVFNDFSQYEKLLLGDEITDLPETCVDEEEMSDDFMESYLCRDTIENMLKEGQEILVQVSKEPLGNKGARVTSHISLPGRYLVFMPTLNHIGISRKIEDKDERTRLKNLINKMKPLEAGFIVRTVGEGKDEEHFAHDFEFLFKLWDNILKKSSKVSATAFLYEELDLVFRTIRDLFTHDIDKLVIDSDEAYERCIEHVDTFMPSLTSRVKPHLKDEPIFDYYNIESKIVKALRKKVWLKSGGYIVIDETEALVAIDVNTGKYVGKRNVEDTIFQTNLEAVYEIARQVRLRNLGGIIIIDFIDMINEHHKAEIMKELEDAFKNDRMRCNILQLTNLGLVEMTRKRTRQSLSKLITKPCPYCRGTGRIKSTHSMGNEILREILRVSDYTTDEILVRVHPDIAKNFFQQGNGELRDIERFLKKKITIEPDESLHHEQFDVVKL